jgi:hypothetical protein
MYSTMVNICSPLQATARSVQYNIPISPAELTYLIAELPPPLILLGNFTVKNVAWNAVFTDERGWLLTEIRVCAGSYIIILNTE